MEGTINVIINLVPVFWHVIGEHFRPDLTCFLSWVLSELTHNDERFAFSYFAF